MSNEPHPGSAGADVPYTPPCAYALHAALWPILARGKGDALSIRQEANLVKQDWRKQGLAFDEAAFEDAVALWDGWKRGYPDIVDRLEDVCRKSPFEIYLAMLKTANARGELLKVPGYMEPIERDVGFTNHQAVYRTAEKAGYKPTIHERVNMLIAASLLDAQWIEVPGLDLLNREQARHSGRPQKQERDRLIRRVHDGIKWTLGLNAAEHKQLIGDLLRWLLPSMVACSERTLLDLVERASRDLRGNEPWLSPEEARALAESGSFSTEITCGKCKQKMRFDGRAKAANKAAEKDGWRIDTKRSLVERYRCPACRAKPEAKSGRSAPTPGANHPWKEPPKKG